MRASVGRWAELVRRVEMGRKVIARQRDLIEHRKSAGLCTISSEGVLATFVTRQAVLEDELAELRGVRSVQRSVNAAHATQTDEPRYQRPTTSGHFWRVLTK